MNGEDKQFFVDLKEHFIEVLDERCKTFDAKMAAADLKTVGTQQAIWTSKEISDLRFKSADDALKQADKVLEARLHTLNQLREQVEHNTNIYLRQDVYNAKTSRYDEWIETVNKDLTVMKTRSIIYTGIVGAFILLIDITLRVLVK